MSSVAERSVSWAPWELPVNPRVSVGSVVDGRGVVAATTCARLGPALAKALLDVNIRSDAATESGYDQVNNRSAPAPLRTARGVDDPEEEDRQ